MSEPTYYVSIERPHNRLYVNAFDVSEEIAKALLWEGVRKVSVYDDDYAESPAEANVLWLGMDWPDPPEGDDDEPEDDEEDVGS